MAKKAKLVVEISGDKSKLDRTLASAKAALQSFGRAAVTGLQAVTAASLVAGAALGAGVKHALEIGDALDEASQKTGIAADQLMILQQAARDAGVEDVTKSINKMQVALVDSVRNGSGPAAKALQMLKLSGSDLIRQSPVQQIEAIGEALKTIKNPALRADITRNLFGKSGPELQAFLGNTDAIKEVTASLGKQAQILKENAAAFGTVNDRLERAHLKWEGFFIGVTEKLLPALDKITGAFDKIDLAETGEKFGQAIIDAADELRAVFDTGKMIFDGFRVIITGVMVQVKAGLAGALAVIKALPGGGKFVAGAEAALAGMTAAITAPFKPMIEAVGMAHAIAKSQGHSFGTAATPSSSAVSPTTRSPLSSALTTGGLSSGRLGSGLDAFYGSATGFTKGGTSGGFRSFGGLSINQGAHHQTPILSVRERRRFENLRVAAGEERQGTTVGAYGHVRRGDSHRAKNEEKRKAKEEETVRTSNARLLAIQTNTKQIADNTSPTKVT